MEERQNSLLRTCTTNPLFRLRLGTTLPALVDAFGARAAEDIAPDEIQQWLDSKADVWSPATRNRYLALMKLTYRLAERNGKITLNPVRLVHAGKEANERVRCLSHAEETSIRTVIAKSYSEHLPEFEIAMMTGMRQGEQFVLTWDRVDLDNAAVRLQKTKNGKPRFVRLNSRALTVMKALHEFSIDDGRVFPLQEFYFFPDAVAEAGIVDFHWHDLRIRSRVDR